MLNKLKLTKPAQPRKKLIACAACDELPRQPLEYRSSRSGLPFERIQRTRETEMTQDSHDHEEGAIRRKGARVHDLSHREAEVCKASQKGQKHMSVVFACARAIFAIAVIGASPAMAEDLAVKIDNFTFTP